MMESSWDPKVSDQDLRSRAETEEMESGPSSTRGGEIADTFNVGYRFQGKFKANLGRGAEASVYAAVYRGNAVAIKEFHAATPESKVEREIGFMSAMRGEYHVVQYLGRYVNPENKVCLVMEVAYNLTLGDLLRSTRGAGLSEEIRVRLAREVCLGVRALHRQGIAHEDIKPDNVLLNFGLRAKVCDFGAAKLVSDPDYPAVSGTRHKKAPEKERGGSYDRLRSDIFSLGLLLQEVLHGPMVLDSAVLSKCVALEPGERPSCDEILAALPDAAPVGYSRFVNVGHTLNHLDESEKFNISYYWTEYDREERPELTQGRAFFFRGLYNEAFDSFRSICDPELPVAHVFLGVMQFHGLGPCAEDIVAARDHFEIAYENSEEDGSPLKAVICYYLAMALMTIDQFDVHERARGFLQQLDVQGNSFGPTLLARMHSQNMQSIYSSSRQRFIANNLFKAVKAGYTTAEAYLTFFYIYNNAKSKIPPMEMEYLQRSVEGGSALGRVLLDFVNDAIVEDELLQTKSAELFMFVGTLFHLTGRTPLARRWFSEVSTSRDGAALMAVTFEDEGNAPEALAWLLKSREYSKSHDPGTEAAGVQYHSEQFKISPQPSWQLRLAEKDLNEGRLDDARSIVADVTSHTRTWYDFMSLRAFALKSSSTRMLVQEARGSLSDVVVFFLAFAFQHYGLRDEAVEWLEECERRGHTEALTTLGVIFYEEQKYERAREYFLRGAKGGSVNGFFNLGVLERDSGENNLQAVEYLEQAVSKGFPPAMAALADLLVQIDKPKHLERAKELHKQSSDLGHDDELWSLVGLSEDSATEALYWIDRALRNVEFAVIAELGIAFEDTSTREIVDRAAQRGTVQALYNKGMWLNLFGDTEEEEEEAYRYFSVAAEKGHINSMSWCYTICEEKRDTDGVGKWRSAMEQRGLYGLVQRLLEMD